MQWYTGTVFKKCVVLERDIGDILDLNKEKEIVGVYYNNPVIVVTVDSIDLDVTDAFYTLNFDTKVRKMNNNTFKLGSLKNKKNVHVDINIKVLIYEREGVNYFE